MFPAPHVRADVLHRVRTSLHAIRLDPIRTRYPAIPPQRRLPTAGARLWRSLRLAKKSVWLSCASYGRLSNSAQYPVLPCAISWSEAPCLFNKNYVDASTVLLSANRQQIPVQKSRLPPQSLPLHRGGLGHCPLQITLEDFHQCWPHRRQVRWASTRTCARVHTTHTQTVGRILERVRGRCRYIIIQSVLMVPVEAWGSVAIYLSTMSMWDSGMVS